MSEYNNTSLAIRYDTDHGEVELSPEIIRKTLINDPAVTDADIAMFLHLCHYQKLNPFLREAYLIKYGSKPAQIIVGKDVYLKRAANNPKFRGLEAGVTVANSKGELLRRTGSLVLSTEKLLAGWCKVHIEDWKAPAEAEASMSEYSRQTATWQSMPGTMIRKVAIVQALREAFPENFQGLYSQEEMQNDEAQAGLPQADSNPSDNDNRNEVKYDGNDVDGAESLTTEKITKEETQEICDKAILVGLVVDVDGKKDMTEFKLFLENLKQAGYISAVMPYKNKEPNWTRMDYIALTSEFNRLLAEKEAETESDTDTEPEAEANMTDKAEANTDTDTGPATDVNEEAEQETSQYDNDDIPF